MQSYSTIIHVYKNFAEIDNNIIHFQALGPNNVPVSVLETAKQWAQQGILIFSPTTFGRVHYPVPLLSKVNNPEYFRLFVQIFLWMNGLGEHV